MDKWEVLRRVFGHETFREGQEALVDALLDGRDVLGVMPTGAGKSMCYQIPALLRPGIALVISPLISLMKDQVAALRAGGVAAAYLNSSLTPVQMDLAMQRAREGAYRIIYVTPERLETDSFRKFARSSAISLVAVDEAHCVSQWGQDFRPPYLRIADFVDSLPERPPVGAFTATATERVRQDIIRHLRLRNPLELTTGFDRPNLFFEVMYPRDRAAALRAILHSMPNRPAIVYCQTRKRVEELYRQLTESGFSAARYHAGMEDEERRASQEAFQEDRVQVMVATNAFGMGIDKSNVSLVVHDAMPKSVEAYYQEAGRAGRDGSQAFCVLFYGRQDVIAAKWLVEHGEPNPDLTAAQQAAVRKQDLLRVSRMADYCETSTCLRSDLLRYFGQTHSSACSGCSNCSGTRFPEAVAAGALSGKVRRSAEKTGKAGKKTVPAKPEADSPLFGKLREVRLNLAKERRVPAYAICTDRVLREIASFQPTTLEALKSVGGMGEGHVRLFGAALINVIRQDRELPPLEETAGAEAGPAAVKPPMDLSEPETPPPLADARELERALAECRLQLARSYSVLPYHVFGNECLKELARQQPVTPSQLMRVKGFKEKRTQAYGVPLLNLIRSCRGLPPMETTASQKAPEDRQDAPADTGPKKTREPHSGPDSRTAAKASPSPGTPPVTESVPEEPGCAGEGKQESGLAQPAVPESMPWLPAESAWLRRRYFEGASLEELMRETGRSAADINRRLAALGMAPIRPASGKPEPGRKG